LWFQARKSLRDPILKTPNIKQGGGVAHVVECIPSQS
jgi:hypothetical protein